MTSSWQWVLLADDLPGADQLKNVNWPLYGGIAGAVLVLIVIGLLMRKRKRPVDPEQGLSENLAGFPPAPGKPGRRRLTVHGQPMRVRLVVVAPTGKKPVSVEDAEALVGSLMQGMGEILKADRPRIKVWPVQYSNIGFAQSFFRRVLRPEPRGRLSNWVRVAGPAKSGATPILLGMALLADEQTDIDEIALETPEWLDVVRVVTD
jgi:hypothetical protein